jgi:crossover junction endodeoxyribonuclease RuvC
MPERPLVLGIDPGLRLCGWGLVRGGPTPEYVAAGVLRPRTRDSIGRRLLHLHTEVARLIATYAPDEMAIEDPFVGALAPASALSIGQARAAALLAGAAAGLDAALYAPAAVKAAVSGYGRGDKAQVQSMVRLLLRLDAPPEPADAADALAVALCHINHRRIPLPTPPRGNRAIGQSGKARSRV